MYLRLCRAARMAYHVCPPTVRKYGWCGVLALVYACGLVLPRTETAFDELLASMERIIGRRKPLWQRSANRKRNSGRGGISLSETRLVLEHYSSRCKYTVEYCGRTTVGTWLKSRPATGTYIVHTGRHAIFMHVPVVRGRWRIYDQEGVKQKKDLAHMKGRGGLLRQRVRAVVTVGDT